MHLRAILSAGALVGLGVLFSRVLGLLREMLLAGHFGVGHEADTAILLLLIPDFITSALAGSAVSATFVPLFTKRTPESAKQVFWQALALSLGVFSLLALLLSLYAGGEGAFFIVFATLPLTAATAILIAYLQYLGRFRVPAFANAIFNGVIILGLWFLPAGIAMLSVSIFCAVMVRMLAHFYAAWRGEGGFLPANWQPWQINKVIMKIYITTMATDMCNLMPQFAPYYVIATSSGGLAIFNYAFRLSVMPAMIGYNIVQMVLLPWFSKLLHENGNSDATYRLTLQSVWAFSLAVCLSLMMARHEAAELCFGYGKMTPADIDRIAHLFALGVWSMFPVVFTCIWLQILYAHGKPRMPFYASIMQALVVLPLCWIGQALMGLEGVMLAYASLQIISVALLSYAGYKQGIIARYRPSIVYGQMTFLASIVWCPLAWLYYSIASIALLKMLLAIMIGAVILVVALYPCAPVRNWLLQKVKRS